MATLEECFIGDDFVIHFEAVDAFGKVVDLTGASIHCSAKLSTSNTKIPAAGSVDGPAVAGKARAQFDASVTALFTPGGLYTYDGVAKLSDGEIHTIGRGAFKAVARVTPQP